MGNLGTHASIRSLKPRHGLWLGKVTVTHRKVLFLSSPSVQHLLLPTLLFSATLVIRLLIKYIKRQSFTCRSQTNGYKHMTIYSLSFINSTVNNFGLWIKIKNRKKWKYSSMKHMKSYWNRCGKKTPRQTPHSQWLEPWICNVTCCFTVPHGSWLASDISILQSDERKYVD